MRPDHRQGHPVADDHASRVLQGSAPVALRQVQPGPDAGLPVPADRDVSLDRERQRLLEHVLGRPEAPLLDVEAGEVGVARRSQLVELVGAGGLDPVGQSRPRVVLAVRQVRRRAQEPAAQRQLVAADPHCDPAGVVVPAQRAVELAAPIGQIAAGGLRVAEHELLGRRRARELGGLVGMGLGLLAAGVVVLEHRDHLVRGRQTAAVADGTPQREGRLDMTDGLAQAARHVELEGELHDELGAVAGIIGVEVLEGGLEEAPQPPCAQLRARPRRRPRGHSGPSDAASWAPTAWWVSNAGSRTSISSSASRSRACSRAAPPNGTVLSTAWRASSWRNTRPPRDLPRRPVSSRRRRVGRSTPERGQDPVDEPVRCRRDELEHLQVLVGEVGGAGQDRVADRGREGTIRVLGDLGDEVRVAAGDLVDLAGLEAGALDQRLHGVQRQRAQAAAWSARPRARTRPSSGRAGCRAPISCSR